MINSDTLKKNYQFKNVFNKGNYFKGKYIDLYIRNNSKNKNYIGIAVGVKITKAVKRNRIKRLIRENYRLLEKDNKILYGYDIIFICKKNINIEEIDFYNVKNDIENGLGRAKVLC